MWEMPRAFFFLKQDHYNIVYNTTNNQFRRFPLRPFLYICTCYWKRVPGQRLNLSAKLCKI